MNGVTVKLHNGSTPLASLSNIQAMWWDYPEPQDGAKPAGKVITSTDVNGDVFLDISTVSGLSVGDYGFLMLYQLDGVDHEDSLVFAGKVQVSNIVSGDDMWYYDSGWTRPADWLTIPAVSATDQVFYGVYAVYAHDANFITVNATGAYTVDWGDGSAPQDVASGVTAQKRILYAAAGAGSWSDEGYRQVLVTITPQSGQTLSNINLAVKHTQSGLPDGGGSQWLDIVLAMNNAGTMTAFYSNTWQARMLKRFEWVGSNAQTNFTNFFRSCYGLREVAALDTSSGTNLSYMFYQCYSITALPLLDASAATTLLNMCYQCYALESVPALVATSNLTCQGMFAYCHSLKSVGLMNISATTSVQDMFLRCYSLETIPLLNTGLVTNFLNFLAYCDSLEIVPALNTASGTNFAAMFYQCFNLRSVPALNTAAGTTFANMFAGCYALGTAALSGTAESINYNVCRLSDTEINAIFTGLATVTAKTITISGNWGAAEAGYDPSIATAKGWTVA